MKLKQKQFFRIFTLYKLCRQVIGYPEYALLSFPYIKRETKKTGLSQNVTWLPHLLQNFTEASPSQLLRSAALTPSALPATLPLLTCSLLSAHLLATL